MRPVLPLCVVLAVAGCSGPSTQANPDGLPNGMGGSCTTQSDCTGCSGCRTLGREVCLSGDCYVASTQTDATGGPRLGGYLVVATFPDGLAAQTPILSAAVRFYYPHKTGGAAVTCTDLLKDPVGADSETDLNVLRELEPQLIVRSADTQVQIGAGQIAIGKDRVLLVRLHDQKQGKGNMVAVGCVEHLDIVQGARCEKDADCTAPQTCDILPGDTAGTCEPLRVLVATNRT